MIAIRISIDKETKPSIQDKLDKFFATLDSEIEEITGPEEEDVSIVTDEVTVVAGPKILIEVSAKRMMHEEQAARTVARDLARMASEAKLEFAITGNYSKGLHSR